MVSGDFSQNLAREEKRRKTKNRVDRRHIVTSWTGLKLEDIIRKMDNRSAWRTTIHSAAYPRTEDG